MHERKAQSVLLIVVTVFSPVPAGDPIISYKQIPLASTPSPQPIFFHSVKVYITFLKMLNHQY